MSTSLNNNIKVLRNENFEILLILIIHECEIASYSWLCEVYGPAQPKHWQRHVTKNELGDNKRTKEHESCSQEVVGKLICLVSRNQ